MPQSGVGPVRRERSRRRRQSRPSISVDVCDRADSTLLRVSLGVVTSRDLLPKTVTGPTAAEPEPAELLQKMTLFPANDAICLAARQRRRRPRLPAERKQRAKTFLSQVESQPEEQ